MAEHLSNESRVWISAVAATAVTNIAGYTALTWVEILEVFDLGEFGDLRNAIETSTLREGRIRRLKGRVDGGTLDLIVNRSADDPGQDKLAEAAKSPFDYALKIMLPDKQTENGDGTTFFFKVTVLGSRNSFGEADNIARCTWSMGIQSERLEVAPD